MARPGDGCWLGKSPASRAIMYPDGTKRTHRVRRRSAGRPGPARSGPSSQAPRGLQVGPGERAEERCRCSRTPRASCAWPLRRRSRGRSGELPGAHIARQRGAGPGNRGRPARLPSAKVGRNQGPTTPS
jgi:hypothetical protein